MCEYCGEKSKEERERLIRDADWIGRKLLQLSKYYSDSARGKVDQHVGGSQQKDASIAALSVVRRLVEDWV